MAEILERPHAPTRRRFDVDTYYRMAEAGVLGDPRRVELIDREIIDMAAIGSQHAEVTNAKFGVPEVWIVGLVGGAVEVYREPKDGAYASRQLLTGGLLSPALVPGVTIDVAGLLG